MRSPSITGVRRCPLDLRRSGSATESSYRDCSLGRRPGKSKVLDADRVLAQVCLNDARGRSDKAKAAFIKQVCAQDHIKSDRAENRWYEVTEPDGRTRRVR